MFVCQVSLIERTYTIHILNQETFSIVFTKTNGRKTENTKEIHRIEIRKQNKGNEKRKTATAKNIFGEGKQVHNAIITKATLPLSHFYSTCQLQYFPTPTTTTIDLLVCV